MKKIHQVFILWLISLILLFPSGCNDYHVSTKVVESAPNFTEKQTNKPQELLFILGKDLKTPGTQYPNSVPLIDGRGSMAVHKGETASMDRAFIISYQDNVEYSWQSDNTGIVATEGNSIQAISEGNTHVRLVTKSGDIIADVDVTVLKSETYRIEKSIKPVVGDYYGAPTLKDNYLYFGTSVGMSKTRPDQNYFYKLDTDFAEIWKFDLGVREVRGSAVFDSDGNIFFTVEAVREAATPEEVNAVGVKENHVSIFLYSLTNDGKLRFMKEITEKGKWYHNGMINCAIDASNTIHIADANLRAYDTKGNVKWQYPVSDDQIMDTRGSPIFDDKGNLFVAMGSTLFCFNTTAGGVPKWEVSVPPTITTICMSAPSLNWDYGRVYFPMGNTVYCIGASNGAKIWEYKPEGIQGDFRANAAVDADGNVYIGTKSDYNSTLYAIKADGSGLLWKIAVGGDLYCSPVLGDDGLLYAASEPSILGAFYVINPASGKIEWSLSETDAFSGTGWTSFRLKDGYIYCVSDIWTKIRVDAKNYASDAGWATFRGSNDNSGYRK